MSTMAADAQKRQNRPLVVALMGLPGAGKTTIASALVDQLGLRRVCRDAIRHAMFPQCDYSFIEKRAAFRGVLLAVEINGLLGKTSVIDGMTFSRREDRDRLVEIADRHGFDLLWLLAACDPARARARIANDRLQAAHPALDRTPALVDALAGCFEELPPGVVRIDAHESPVRMCEAALKAVAARLQEHLPG
ncbi:AAA family ATPase [Dokdonella sp.]|uniref:AAA family ATPase n=1 Tax=Dokdonella sp. TaxID=2291710 RepID=UPI003783DCBC